MDGNKLKLLLFVALGLLSAAYIARWARNVRIDRRAEPSATEGSLPTLLQGAIGFVTNFFDTLGIGSFATTTTTFKLLRIVRDELIPGTLLVGHTLPVMAQAFIFMTVVKVDPMLLVLTIIAMISGGWLGAGIVARLPRRWIQVGMGIALLLAAASMLMSQFGLFPAGGAATSLSFARTCIAVAVYFLLGALIALGIGHYGPSLVLFSLLGMDPHSAFPIMAGAGAFTGVTAGARFLELRCYDKRAALGLALGGIPGVLLAAFVVKSLSIDAVRWLVVIVIVYTAAVMLRTAYAERRSFPNPGTVRPATQLSPYGESETQ